MTTTASLQDDHSAESFAANPEKALAKGVLQQARKGLRLFHAAQDTVGHALYLDAYTWLMSNDSTWPYSFNNVCGVLGLSTEATRSDLIADIYSPWYSRSFRAIRRIAVSSRVVVTNVLRRPMADEFEGSLSPIPNQ